MSRPVEDIPAAELHVERDMAREYLLRVNNAREFAHQTYADLDGYADGDLAEAPTRHFREAQEHLAEAADLLESEAGVVESRFDAIRERIEGSDDA